MSKASVETIYPLSNAQKMLLFHSLREDSDLGFLQVKCTIHGQLDRDTFQKAWQRTIFRHEALRTSVHWRNIKKAVLVVHSNALLPWDFYDLRGRSPINQKEEIVKLKSRDSDKKLDLSKAPVSRLTLIQLDDNKHSLLWSCHHIFLDGWSAAIILKDTFDFYNAIIEGREAQLVSLPLYKSYLTWFQKQDYSQAEIYWKKTLDGFVSPILDNKSVKHSNGVQTPFESHTFSLSAESTDLLNKFGRKNRVTLNTIVHGLIAILLSNYYKSRDIVLGTSVSGRSAPIQNIELMAGLFTNTLPVRMKLDTDYKVSEWLGKLQINLAAMRNFEYTSMAQIMPWINWPGHVPLFECLLVFENFPWQNLENDIISIKDFEGGITTAFPLTILIKPGNELNFLFRYDQHKFLDKNISWFSKNLTVLLSNVLKDQDKNILDLYNSVDHSSLIKDHVINNIKPIETDNKYKYIPPSTAIEIRLVRIWEALLGKSKIGTNDDFFDLGGNSLLAVQMFSQIENQLGYNLSPASLLQYPTIDGLSSLIRDDVIIKSWSSLVPIRTSGNKAPLFCLHARGAHVFFYSVLARHLGDEQPVYALQPRGLDGKEPLYKSIEEMASHYLDEIRTVQEHGPYAFIATCFSSEVGLEMAQQLQRHGESVSLLAMVDTPPPLPNIKPTSFDFIKRIVRLFRYRSFGEVSRILLNRMYKSEQIKTYQDVEKNLFKSEQLANLEKIQYDLQMLYHKYQSQPYQGKITFIRSKEQSKASWMDFHVNQWKSLALGGLTIIDIPGFHLTLFEEPDVRLLAKEITLCLENAYKTLT
ncbi:MAG: condensation domain-containing protein [Saprospiraceae bacterium]